MCTKSRYVTLEVVKTHLNSNKGYDFSIRVKQSDNIIEEGVVVASISAFVGIVVGVVVLIAVVACTILYCCLKRTRSGPAGVAAAGGAGRGGGGAGGEGSNKDVESARQHDSLVEPTAPPLPDAEESHERQRLYPQAPQLYPQPATPQLYPTTPQLYPPAEDPPPYVHPPPYDEQETTTAAGHAHSPHDVTAVKQAL
ncbi:uncharacterized protein LOC106013943 [Aplysia californica]|uniref:Uncharacterized protein LOC106013943 n=1 Tax=Aplysia californica TaxID=6500 RepID=A0ABM1AET1_APLCA|nr:uncharacterized protein LOC106013943 [Aplysia californica]